MCKWKSSLTLVIIGLAGVLAGQGFAWAQESMPMVLGQSAYRLGNAVLFTTHVRAGPNDNSSISKPYLAACSGSWLSSSLGTEVFEGSTFDVKRQSALVLERMRSPVVWELRFFSWSNHEEPQVSNLRARVLALCKSAPPAPRNTLIPITHSEDIAISVISGTTVRKGNLVEVWSRHSTFRKEPVLFDGKPFILPSGKEVTRDAITEQRILARSIHNCSDRTMADLSVTKYDANGRMIDFDDKPRKDAEFTPLVPSSLGEAQHDFVCTVF